MVKCGVLFEVRTEFINNIDKLRLQRVKTKVCQSDSDHCVRVVYQWRSFVMCINSNESVSPAFRSVAAFRVTCTCCGLVWGVKKRRVCSPIYLTTLYNSEWLCDQWRDVKGSWRGLILSSVQAFAWRDWGKSRISVDGFLPDRWT
jgi:hypothetical protein